MWRAPTQPPPFEVLRDQLPARDARAIGRYLGVSERTVRRWCADGRAPLAAVRALYWETPAGFAWADEPSYRELDLRRRQVRNLEALCDELRGRIRLLEDGGVTFGAANGAYFRAL